jgi:hypothetical protein
VVSQADDKRIKVEAYLAVVISIKVDALALALVYPQIDVLTIALIDQMV